MEPSLTTCLNGNKAPVSGGHVNRKLASVASELVLAEAVRDKIALASSPFSGNDAQVGLTGNNSLEPTAFGATDEELEEWRERRKAQLQRRRKREEEFCKQGSGSYEDVDEQVFFAVVTKAERTICHFYHKEYKRCEVMDFHLKKLAERHVETRFLRVNCEKSPFLVSKLKIRVLPTVVTFLAGVASKFLIGFTELGSQDTFKTEALERVLCRSKALQPLEHSGSETEEDED